MPRGPFASLPPWSLYAIAMAPAVLLIVLMPLVRLPDVWDLALVAASLVWALAFVGIYWGRLDEASREAQRSAMLWGGTFGILAAFIAGTLIAFTPDGAGWIAHLSARLGERAGGRLPDTSFAFVAGMVFCAVSSVLGFMVAWMWWWARRR